MVIGELSEKGVHNGLKNWLEPNKANQEVCVGKFVADIKKGNEIIEIQTRSFKKLVPKLDYYKSQNYNVTIVYPLEVTRYIVKLQNNIEVHRRKAPHKGVVQDILYEAYWLLPYLDNITLQIIFVEVDDCRTLDNKKQDRVLTKIIGQEDIHGTKDFIDKLIPFNDPFTMAEFKEKTGIKVVKLNPLKGLLVNNMLEIVDKQRNTLLYKKVVDNSDTYSI